MRSNSIGIKEGTVVSEKCFCVWETLLSIPPKHVLKKKCHWCKEQDGEDLDGPGDNQIRALLALHKWLSDQIR